MSAQLAQVAADRARFRRVPAGSPAPTPQPARPLLTDGQIELLQMVAAGLGHDAIGRRLGISRSATSTRLDRIYNRIGAINAPNAVAIAIRAGLLP